MRALFTGVKDRDVQLNNHLPLMFTVKKDSLYIIFKLVLN